MLTFTQAIEEQKNLEKLCSDSPPRPLITKELFHPNAYYGNDQIYKKYAGLSKDIPLKIALPHGPVVDGQNKVWAAEISNSLPAVAACSDIQYSMYCEALEKTGTSKEIYQLASPFLYLFELIKVNKLVEVQIKRRGTIFFPAHSTHHIQSNVNSELIAEKLVHLESEYQPVTICMYWRDFNLKRYVPYLKRGLRIVSAGHIYDPNFLFRFYYLCSLHSYAAGNFAGSHIPFSIKSGCSYFHFDFGFSKHNELEIKKSDPAQYIMVSRPEGMLLPNEWYQLFKNRKSYSNSEQIAVVDRYLGSDYFKTADGLKQQFMQADLLYKHFTKNRQTFTLPRRENQVEGIAFEIIQSLNLNENEKVLTLSDQYISKDPYLIGILYGKAIALSRLGRYNEAVDCLNYLLAKYPEHKKAAVLLKALKENTLYLKGILKQAKEYLSNGNVQQAFKLLNQLKAGKKPIQNLDLLRAYCFLRMKQFPSAQQALEEELRYFSGNAEARKLLGEIISKNNYSVTKNKKESEFLVLLKKIRSYTMLSEERLYSLFTLTKQVCLNDIAGNIAECGVAAGGSTALMAAIIHKYSKRPRLLYAFDSFEGMPRPSEHDKHDGIGAEDTGWGTGTCAAPEEKVKSISQLLGVSHIVKPVKGYFEKTLLEMKHKVGPLAFLHMDGDWYESSKTILDNLYDCIREGGIIQVDDYGFWEGCRKAIHEFEQKRNIQFKVNEIDSTGVWFYKV